MKQKNHKKIHDLLFTKSILLLAAFIFCFFLCRFSPTTNLVESEADDYACFFMAGKAWFYGYLPYVDFIDVKGPLLFLVFKIGYSLSPGSTTGIFIIFVLILFLTLLFVQLTINIYLKNELLSLIGAICLLGFRVLATLTLYGRAEDIILLPIAISVYFGTVYFKNRDSNKKPLCFACTLGVCCALAFLIKFNTCFYFFGIAVMTSSLLAIDKKWSALIYFFLFGFIAFFLTLTPFFIYLFFYDIWNNFVDVYFYLNFETYGKMNKTGLNTVIACIAARLINNIYFLAVYLYLFTIHFLKKSSKLFSKKESFYFLVSATLLFLTGNWAHPYYMVVCIFSAVPLIIVVLDRLSDSFLYYKKLTLCLCLILPIWIVGYNKKTPSIIRGLGLNTRNTNINFYFNTTNNPIDQILEKDKYAKVIYFNCMDKGFGVKGEVLPACPNWMNLNGLPKEHKLKMESAIEKHLANYVIVANIQEQQGNELLEKFGYKLITSCRIPERMDLWKYSQDK